MKHVLHTCIVSYNRLDLTKQAVESYLRTVKLPFTLAIIDNASTDGTVEWLQRELLASIGVRGFEVTMPDLPSGTEIRFLDRNYYPGYACNRGWELAPPEATLLQRCDNDFSFRPGWCNEIVRRFSDPQVGQVGLRTDQEELFAPWNVGGNAIIRRELWDQGLRYDERPWEELGGTTEDYYLSQEVQKRGYRWERVRRSCIVSLASGDLGDPYYQESYGVRGIIDPGSLKGPLGVKE